MYIIPSLSSLCLLLQLMSSLWAQHIFSTALLMSLLSTLAIAVERFIIFRVDPFGNRKIITPRRAILVFSVTWVFVTGIFYLGAHFRDRYLVLGKVVLTSSIWITMIGTAACYGFVYRRITSESQVMGQSESFLRRRVKVHQKIIMTFSLVIGSTTLCWVPLTVAEFLKGFSQFGDRGWCIALNRVSFSILCFNQVLNPIIIWSRLTDFRNQLRGCRRGCRANSREDQEKNNVTPVFSVPVNDVPVNVMTVDRIVTTSP